MKTNFTIKSMEIALNINGEQQVVKTPEIHTEVEASIGELRGLYELQKQVLLEMPAFMEDFSGDLAKALLSIRETFQNVEESIAKEGHAKRERTIDEWFTEYFLAVDTTKEAKETFYKYFNGDKKETLAKLITRVDFFSMPIETKEAFFDHICGTCF